MKSKLFEASSMKYRLARALRNFLVLNVMIVIPVITLYLSFFSDKVEVSAATGVPCRITFIHGDDERTLQTGVSSGDGGVCSLEAVLPDSTGWRRMKVKFTGDCEAHLIRFSVLKGGMFRFSFSKDDIKKAFHVQMSDGSLSPQGADRFTVEKTKPLYVVARPNISLFAGQLGFYKPVRVMIAFGALELMLLIIAFLAAVFVNVKFEFRWIKENLLATFVTAFFFGVVLPVQSFIANRSLFQLGWYELSGALVMRFMWLFFVLSIVAIVCARCFGRKICAAILLALAFCGYLETGVLAVGLPTLNGNLDYYTSMTTRGFWDLGILLSAFLMLCVMVCMIRRGIEWGAAILLVLFVASLADIHIDQKADEGRGIVSEFHEKSIIAQNVIYSNQRNVLVFVLDALTSEAAHDALEREPRLKKYFKGFVEYPNNIGMYGFTHAGVAGMLTGKYLEDPLNAVDYYYSIFTTDSVLKNAIDAGMSIFFMPGSYPFGYTNQGIKDGDTKIQNQNDNPLRRHIKGLQAWNLDEITVFRLMPFLLKPICHTLIERHWDVEDAESESTMFPVLARGPVSDKAPPTFLLTHTHGTHAPILFYSNGQRRNKPAWNYDGYVGQAQFVLTQLGQLFDYYRRIGIYDSSVIIVLSDHGALGDVFARADSLTRTSHPLPTAGRPFLWTKAAGATNLFSSSSALTSHAGVSALICKSIKDEIDVVDIKKILCSKQHEYREDKGLSYDSWVMDDKGEVSYSSRVYAECSVGDLSPLRNGRNYSLRRSDNKDKLAIIFDRARDGWWGPCLDPGMKSTQLRFRVSEPKRKYRITISIKPLVEETWRSDSSKSLGNAVGLKMSFRSADAYYETPPGLLQFDKISHVVFDGVFSNDNGLVAIDAVRNEGVDIGTIFFTDIKVEERE